MHISTTMCLPRDAASVPVIRRMIGGALSALGVHPEVRDDIQLALSEACTNVIDHAHSGDEYEVRVTLDDQRCSIDVIDTGRGIDLTERFAARDLEALSGRGLYLIEMVTDSARWSSPVGTGTIVHFEKALAWDDTAPPLLAAR